MRKSYNLFVFDIDGTLLDIFMRGHKPIFEAAGRIVHPDAIVIPGKNRGGTAFSTIQGALEGLVSEETIYLNEPKIILRIEELLGEYLSDSKNLNLLPGVRQLLDKIYSCENSKLGIVTGNVPNIANLLLSAHGIRHYFDFCSFAENRNDTRYEIFDRLIGYATEQAGKPRRIFSFGDSESDIRVGEELGATTVGVTTGGHTLEELKGFGADYTFEDLSDTRLVLSTLFP